MKKVVKFVFVFVTLFFVFNINLFALTKNEWIKNRAQEIYDNNPNSGWYTDELSINNAKQAAIDQATKEYEELVKAGKDPASQNSASGNNIDFSDEEMSCEEIMGENLMKVLKAAFVLLRVGAAIIVIIKASLALIPAIQKGDDGEIKKATKKCITLAVVLVVVGLLPTLVNVIAKICGFENSCVAALL